MINNNTTADIFISHSSKDAELCDSLCSYFEEREIKCWVGPRDTAVGKNYAESIVNAIRNAKLMIVLFSKNANQSAHVANEVERASHYNLHIIPFKVDESLPTHKLELFLSSVQWLEVKNGNPGSYFHDLYEKSTEILNINPGYPKDKSLPVRNSHGFLTVLKTHRKKIAIGIIIAALVCIAAFSGNSIRDFFKQNEPVAKPVETKQPDQKASTTGDNSPAIITRDGNVNINYADSVIKKDSTKK
jgi:TIR domain